MPAIIGVFRFSDFQSPPRHHVPPTPTSTVHRQILTPSGDLQTTLSEPSLTPPGQSTRTRVPHVLLHYIHSSPTTIGHSRQDRRGTIELRFHTGPDPLPPDLTAPPPKRGLTSGHPPRSGCPSRLALAARLASVLSPPRHRRISSAQRPIPHTPHRHTDRADKTVTCRRYVTVLEARVPNTLSDHRFVTDTETPERYRAP